MGSILIFYAILLVGAVYQIGRYIGRHAHHA
jgi:hypothetical protein